VPDGRQRLGAALAAMAALPGQEEVRLIKGSDRVTIEAVQAVIQFAGDPASLVRSIAGTQG